MVSEVVDRIMMEWTSVMLLRLQRTRRPLRMCSRERERRRWASSLAVLGLEVQVLEE